MPPKKIIDPEQNTSDAFFISDEQPVEIFYRSTAELGCGCPAAGKMVDNGKAISGGELASVGSLVHDAIGKAISEFLFHWPESSPRQFREDLDSFLENTEPGYQPEVIEGCRRSVYEITRFISDLPAPSILGYDGGSDSGRSSQYTTVIDERTHFTSEMDLVHKDLDQDEVIKEMDYKSGWMEWTKAKVKGAFQFGSHAMLLFDAFPKCQEVQTTIWNTRINRQTYTATFYREDRDKYFTRVKKAIERVREFRLRDALVTEPTPERCRICDAAALCPLPHEPIVMNKPGDFITQMQAVEVKLKAMKKIAADYVESTGRDIITNDICFGANKPKSERKEPKVFYINLNKVQE